jgi:hypothetical protein
MKRLIENNINTPEEYDRIYSLRSQFPADSQDIKRWKRIMKYYKGGSVVDLGCLDSRIPSLIEDSTLYSG